MKKCVFVIFFVCSLFSKLVKFDIVFDKNDKILTGLIAKEDLAISRYTSIDNPMRLCSIVENDKIFCQKKLKGVGLFEGSVEYSIVEDEKKYKVTIDIKKGAEFKVRSLKVVSALGSIIDIKDKDIEGKRLDFEKLLTLEDKIIQKFSKTGHPFVKVVKKHLSVIHKDKLVDVEFVVNIGKRANFGEVVIKGNNSVNSEFIMKQLTWEKGEVFDSRKVESLRKKLLGFNLFNQVMLKVFKDSDDRAGILIRVVEAKMHLFEIGAKYSTANNTFYSRKITRKITGVMGITSWSNFNVFGNGEILTLTAAGTPFYSKSTLRIKQPEGFSSLRSGKEKDIKISPDSLLSAKFQKPKYDGIRDMVFETLLYNTWNIKYVKRSKELEANISRVINDKVFHSIGVSSEHYKLREFSSDKDSFVQEQKKHYTFLSFGYKVVFNWLDDIYDPKHGGKLEAYLSPKFGRNTNLVLCHVKHTQMLYLNPLVLGVWASYDCLFISNHHKIPADKMLYSGGPDSIRAYAKNYACEFDGNYPRGGKSCVECGIELIAKLSKEWAAIAFFEASKVGDKDIPRNEKTFSGYGFGARYYTSFVPISIEVAFPTRRRSGVDAGFQILISVGKNI